MADGTQPVAVMANAAAAPLPSIEIAFEAEETDTRASQFACTIVITNRRPTAIDIASIMIRKPNGVVLSESVDTAKLESERRHEALCNQLSQQLQATNVTLTEPFAKLYADNFSRVFAEAMRPTSLMGHYFRFMIGGWAKFVRRVAERIKLFEIKINSAAEAQTFRQRLPDKSKSAKVTTPPAAEAQIQLIDALIAQLKELENKMGFTANRVTRQRIPPGEQHTMVYVVKGIRPMFQSKAYAIQADVVLEVFGASSSEPERISRTVGTKFLVTPDARALTLTAIGYAALGVALSKIAKLESGGDLSWQKLGESLWNSPSSFVIGMLTAVVALNLFDFTTLRDRLQGRMNWRFAAFVGALSGLFSDKILAMFNGLLN